MTARSRRRLARCRRYGRRQRPHPAVGRNGALGELHTVIIAMLGPAERYASPSRFGRVGTLTFARGAHGYAYLSPSCLTSASQVLRTRPTDSARYAMI